MTKKRTVEIFVAGCPVCEDAINLVNRIACPSCAVTVLDMKDPMVATRAKGRGVDEGMLRAAGIGTPIS